MTKVAAMASLAAAFFVTAYALYRKARIQSSKSLDGKGTSGRSPGAQSHSFAVCAKTRFWL
jgi:hypothetical protein